jgi:hypothetical protein
VAGREFENSVNDADPYLGIAYAQSLATSSIAVARKHLGSMSNQSEMALMVRGPADDSACQCRENRTMEDADETITWAFVDAWLLTAIGGFGRRGCPLNKMIGVATR